MTDDRAVQSPALPHVDLIDPDVDPAHPRRTTAAVAVEVARALPNLAKLFGRLMREPRVPRRTKLLVGAAVVYFVSPVDLIPELLFPVVGRLDDLLVVAFALDRLMRSVDPAVLRAHWDGEGDALEMATALIGWAVELMPGPMGRLIDSRM